MVNIIVNVIAQLIKVMFRLIVEKGKNEVILN
jgi:hypothetical protein